MKSHVLVLTCEHAGNQVPDHFSYLFDGAGEVLSSHRGWDPGALEISQTLSESFQSDLVLLEHTRLLIEVNRSLDHPQLFSEYSQSLDQETKTELINTYYLPYRSRVEQRIKHVLRQYDQVIHLSVHTFTPVWNGKERAVEIGLLFDDNRSNEREFCKRWMTELEDEPYCIRANEPYRGADDGFTTFLRTRFDPDDYLGIELEVNQKFVDTSDFHSVQKILTNSLHKTLS